MKVKIFYSLFLLLCCISCKNNKTSTIPFKGHLIKIEEYQEPPLIFKIMLNDSVYEVLENNSDVLKGNFNNPTIKIAVNEWRYFTHGDISFEYPKNYSFDANLGILVGDTWNLTYKNFSIIYQKTLVEIPLNQYLKQLTDNFGIKKCITSDISKTLNHVILKGKRLNVSLVNQKISMEIYQIKSKTNNYGFLIFQNSFVGDEENKKNEVIAIKKIEETFKLNTD